MLRAKSGLYGPGIALGLVVGIVPFAATAQGVVVYGNYDGTNVNYLNVSETPTQQPGPTPTELYGPPTISADSLIFNPVNFVSSASGGSTELQDGRLTLNVTPNGPAIPSFIDIFEGGAWEVTGGTQATAALEALLVNQMTITSVNGTPINPVVVTPTITFTDTANAATVTDTSDSIEFNSTGGIADGTWNGTASFDLPAALAAAGLSGNVTGVSLALNDQLITTSETNSTAFIDKKFFEITAPATPVPEPVTLSGVMVAGAALLSRRRRRLA
jgi:hypothetical protein